MADLNCISKKTLRVYREQGLLEPVHVDEENGYRFYSIEQSAKLDMIQQLSGLGISLAETKTLMETGSIEELSQTLESRIAALREERQRIELAQHNAECLLRNCRFFKDMPLCDTIIIERIRPRRVIHFPILYEESAVLDPDAAAYLPKWEMNLRLTKRSMLENGLPIELFHNVGCCISAENLTNRKLELTSSFIFIQFERVANRFDADVLPEQDYLTLYKSAYSEQGAKNSEVEGLITLLDYIESAKLEIAGDYYGEIIADSPAFLYEGREMFYKLQIPVKRH